MRQSHLFAATLVALAPFAMVAPARAVDDPAIAAARAAGILGEQADGYLGFVRPPTADQAELQRRVADINIRRRAVYTDLAASQSQTVEVVAALTAEKLIAKTPAGQFYKDGKAGWTKK